MKGLSRHELLVELRGYGLEVETAGIEWLRDYAKLMRDVPAADRAAAVQMVNLGSTPPGRPAEARGGLP